MEFAISFVLAWLYLGVRRAFAAFSGDPLNRPMWTYGANAGRLLVYILVVWPLSYGAEARSQVGFRDPKVPWIAVMTFITEFGTQTLIFWAAYSISIYLAEGIVGQVLLALLFFVLGSAILKPMVQIACSAIGGLILAIVFPARTQPPQP